MSNLLKLYTPKQLEIYKRTLLSDWFMLINHGAKRSGKTILNNDLFLQELIRVRKQADREKISTPMYILSGVTLTTIFQNVLQELINKYGLEIRFDRFNNFYLFGVYVVQVGHGTIAGLGKIRGMTAYGAYINEASLANEFVFDEIKSRCSGYGARILSDTNPDNPEHWLLKKYIQNEDPAILSYQFSLYDNTFLNERYIENIVNTTPSGIFTDRNIYGKWTSGEGVVYRDFDNRLHYVEDLSEYVFVDYIVGVDWGYSHYGAIVVIGVTETGTFVVAEEHAMQYREIDYWVEVAKDIVSRYGNLLFYCDPARPEYIKRFRREGINAVNANNAIMAGVERIAQLIKSGLFFVISSVKRFRTEINMYEWDKRTGKPIGLYDDVLDAIRYAIYSYYANSGKITTVNKKRLGI